MGGVAVPKSAINTVHRPVRHRFGVASPRGDAPEVLVGKVAVPKTGQKNALSREDATETSVGNVAVPKDVHKNASPREDAAEVPVGRVAVPKTGQKPPSPREDATEVPVGGPEPRPCLAARPCLQQKKDDLSSHPCGAENET